MKFFIVDRIEDRGSWDVCYEVEKEWIPYARIKNVTKYRKQDREAFANALMDAYMQVGCQRKSGKVCGFQIEDYFNLEPEVLLDRLEKELQDQRKLVDF